MALPSTGEKASTASGEAMRSAQYMLLFRDGILDCYCWAKVFSFCCLWLVCMCWYGGWEVRCRLLAAGLELLRHVQEVSFCVRWRVA